MYFTSYLSYFWNGSVWMSVSDITAEQAKA